MNTLPRTAGIFQTEAKTCSKKGKGTNRNWGEKSKLQLYNLVNSVIMVGFLKLLSDY